MGRNRDVTVPAPPIENFFPPKIIAIHPQSTKNSLAVSPNPSDQCDDRRAVKAEGETNEHYRFRETSTSPRPGRSPRFVASPPRMAANNSGQSTLAHVPDDSYRQMG